MEGLGCARFGRRPPKPRGFCFLIIFFGSPTQQMRNSSSDASEAKLGCHAVCPAGVPLFLGWRSRQRSPEPWERVNGASLAPCTQPMAATRVTRHGKGSLEIRHSPSKRGIYRTQAKPRPPRDVVGLGRATLGRSKQLGLARAAACARLFAWGCSQGVLPCRGPVLRSL